jgi:hypothetical protein
MASSSRPSLAGINRVPADVYFGYAQAEYAVGDQAEGDRWMTAYYGQIGFLIAYGC